MAWSSSWKASAAAVVVLLGRSSLGQSRCANSTLIIRSYEDIELAEECATVVDGVNTLQHSLHIIYSEGDIPLIALNDIRVVIGEILLSTYAGVSSDVALAGHKLENITGGIKVVCDRTSSSRTGLFPRTISFTFPTLRSVSSFEVDSLDDWYEIIDVRFGHLITTSVRITGTLGFNLDFLNSTASRPSNFYFLRNTSPNYHGDESAKGSLTLPLEQVTGHLEISDNPDLATLSIPYLESAGAMILSNNTALEQFDSPITRLGSIFVEGNPAARLTLPHLQSLAGPSFFSNLAFLNLESLHNTTEPGTDLSFSDNIFTDLQLPSLVAVATGLSIQDNPLLNDINLAYLHRINGSLTVKGNPRLLTFLADRLVVVKGSVRLVGSFTNVKLDRLEEVAGDFEVAGDASMDCSWFNEHFRGKVVKGRYSCTGNHTIRQPSFDEELHGEGLSTGAKAGIVVGGAIGAILAIGFSVWALLAWKRKRATAGPSTGAEAGKSEMDGAGRPDPQAHELGVTPVSEPRAHQLDISLRPRTPELGVTPVSEPRAHQLDISPRPRTPELSDTCRMAELA